LPFSGSIATKVTFQVPEVKVPRVSCIPLPWKTWFGWVVATPKVKAPVPPKSDRLSCCSVLGLKATSSLPELVAALLSVKRTVCRVSSLVSSKLMLGVAAFEATSAAPSLKSKTAMDRVPCPVSGKEDEGIFALSSLIDVGPP